MRKPTVLARVFAAGQALTVAVLAVLFVGAGVDDLKNRAEPVYWGTFTQRGCVPENGWDECRLVGDWESDDGTLVKRDIYLDGDPLTGSVSASFRPIGHPNDEQNNVVHTTENSGLDWLPWVGAASCVVVGLACGLLWWTRRGRAFDEWLG